MSDKKMLILLAAIGSVIVSATVPIVSFSQQQAAPGSNETATSGGNATGGNLTTFEEEAMNAAKADSNATTTAPSNATNATTTAPSNATNATTTAPSNATNATTTAPSNATLARQKLQEQRNALFDAFLKNITSGNTKVLMVTLSNQRGVPVEHEQRDVDPLGTVGFADDGASMQIQHPNYASGANLTSSLYPGGRLSFMFENIPVAPDDIDVLFISPNDLRTPIAIHPAGFDTSFRIPDTLENGHSYYVMVSMHWPDLHHDVLMGIKGKATVLQQP
jgi:hypothetical protein